MAKHPIAWHESNLRMRKMHLERVREDEERRARRELDYIARVEQSVITLESQIARAKRLGKDGFDAEKFQPEKGGE